MNTIPELSILRSQRFIVYVAFFTVIFLTPNSYYVYYGFCPFIYPFREIASGGVALIIASAILIYTVRKNEPVALTFAWFEVMVAAYYYITSIGWDWGLIPALGFACILPYSVKMYTGEIGKIVIDDPEEDKKNLKIFLDKNPGKRPEDFFKNK